MAPIIFGRAAAAAISIGIYMAGTASADQFIVRVYNSAEPGSMIYADGTRHDPLLSWGIWVVHAGQTPLFVPGQPAGDAGLEDLAEDGNPYPLEKSLARHPGGKSFGLLEARPVDGEATLHPGGLFRVIVDAEPGDRLSIAVMLEQSNDLFYAPAPEGIPFFDASGNPTSGDVTGQILLWDAGTEVNQPPGIGPDNGINQSDLNVGPDENGVVRLVDDGFDWPAVADVIRVTVEPR